jgi:hypothetical protein
MSEATLTPAPLCGAKFPEDDKVTCELRADHPLVVRQARPGLPGDTFDHAVWLNIPGIEPIHWNESSEPCPATSDDGEPCALKLGHGRVLDGDRDVWDHVIHGAQGYWNEDQVQTATTAPKAFPNIDSIASIFGLPPAPTTAEVLDERSAMFLPVPGGFDLKVIRHPGEDVPSGLIYLVTYPSQPEEYKEVALRGWGAFGVRTNIEVLVVFGTPPTVRRA